jgi:hypothetical protein
MLENMEWIELAYDRFRWLVIWKAAVSHLIR